MPDLTTIRAFAAADKGLAVVAFARADGSVHQSLVNAGVMTHPVTGEDVIAFAVRANAVKLRHWRSEPRASIVFRSGWAWAGVEGNVSILGPEDLNGYDPAAIPQLLRDVFTSAGGTHDDWGEYDRVMAVEGRTAVFIHPAKIRGAGSV